MALFSTKPDLSRYRSRLVWMLVLTSIIFLLLIGRLYNLQITHGEEYLELSRANFVSTRRVEPLRGMIFDRRGELLADNRPSFNLYFTPAFCGREAFESTLGRLTEYLGLSETEVEDTRTLFSKTRGLDRFLAVLLRRNMTWTEVALVEQHLDVLEGVEVRPETLRAYPRGDLAAHLLGYLGEIGPAELAQLRVAGYLQGDSIGKAGVEKAWEPELRGSNGWRRVVVDARGQRVPESQARAVLDGPSLIEPSVPGSNLILSIDARLQALAETRFPGREGAVVAVDPQTGFVLAMVSRPAFDPNQVSGRVAPRTWRELVEDPERPLTNRATQQHYPPGSTFKPFTGLAALVSGALTVSSMQSCNGQFRFGDHVFRCWRAAGHGSLAIHRALVQSCDVFFYRAGQKAGLDAIAQLSWSFGFGSPTGFDSAQEVPGIMPDREWYARNTRTGFLPGFTISDAIGQGDVNVTPLQLVLAYAALANGGTLYRPQVVWRVERPTGEATREFEAELTRRIQLDPALLQAITDGLAGVVNEPGGTAYFRRPRTDAFQVAGKTGTAQVVKQGADRGRGLPYEFRDHAWFVGWAPLERPRIAVAVVNEHGGHGSSAAAPLVMELITYFLEQLSEDDSPPERGGE